MNESILSNIIKFLERTPVTGKESLAWCEAYMAINQEVSRLKHEAIEKAVKQ